MKKYRRRILFVLLAVTALCLTFAGAGCKKDKTNAREGSYDLGEQGFYYYDGTDGERYILSLESGDFMISVNDETGYSGTYSYDEESGVISFVSKDASFIATMKENSLSVNVDGEGHLFKAYVYFEVTYLGGDGNVLDTRQVLNGQPAPSDIGYDEERYILVGWYLDSDFSNEFSFNTSVASDLTLYGCFIEINAEAAEYVVTLVYPDGAEENLPTRNGAVWSLPESYLGRDILGWWVSAMNTGTALTYKYAAGEALPSDTRLFAVCSGENVLGASVRADGVTWENTNLASDVTVYVTDEDGYTLSSGRALSSAKKYTVPDFSYLETGTYHVRVASGAVTETLVYVVNPLSRVSASSIETSTYGNNRVLTFSPVPYACGYEIYVTNGETELTVDIGADTYYVFSNIDMTKSGITFVITAYADGYVSSVSDKYTLVLVLDDVTVSVSDDEISWTEVSGADAYEVIIKKDDGDFLSFTTTEPSYSLKYCDAGTYDVYVRAVAVGYYSDFANFLGYGKQTLAAPKITDVTSYTVTWTDVGADWYEILILGISLNVGSATEVTLSDYGLLTGQETYELSVRACSSKGFSSPYSDAVTVSDGDVFFGVTYSENAVHWNFNLGAASYEVSVNGENTYRVTSGNSCEVELTKAGENEIIVTAFDKQRNEIGSAAVTVWAYLVALDGNGAVTEKDFVYLADGDILHLGGVIKDYTDFLGWYTLPDYTDGQSDVYGGKGYLVADGSVFTEGRDMYLYAYWSYQYVDVTLVINGGTLGEGEEESVRIKYGSTSYVLPVPAADIPEDDFMGWYVYIGEDEEAVKVTDAKGVGIKKYTGEDTLYAVILETRKFTETTYDGETVYSVSAGDYIDGVEELTIPESYMGCSLILSSSAFNGCKTIKVINIPDTVRYISTVNSGFESGTGAFSGCSALEEVNIYETGDEPDPRKEVLYYSYRGVLFHKTSSSSVEILYYPHAKAGDSYVMPAYVSNSTECGEDGSSVELKVTTVPVRVFQGQTFEEVVVPSTVTFVAGGAFYDCPNLTTVIFAEGGDASLTFSSSAFQKCPKLTNVTFPARFSEIDGSIFEECDALTDIFIEDGGMYASDGGILLSADKTTLAYFPCGRGGDIVIDKVTSYNITRIGDFSFAKNTKITSVTITSNVRYIGEGAFSGCTNLKEIIFDTDEYSPNLTIKSDAFSGCVALTSLTLPENLTVLEKNAFSGCTNLTYVYFDAREGTALSDLNFEENAFGAESSVMTLVFGPNVPAIDFVGVFGKNLENIVIDDENEHFMTDDAGAVYDGQGLVILYYPADGPAEYTLLETTETVGVSVFAGNTVLTKITIPASVTFIAEGAFLGCTSLEEICVEEGSSSYMTVDGILYSKVNGEARELICCPIQLSIETVTVPETVVYVPSYAFAKNQTVTEIVFGEPETFTLGDHAFYNAAALVTVILPDSLTEIPDYAFAGCVSLLGDLSEDGQTKLPASTERVGEHAFDGCVKLAVTIPSGVSFIGDYAFYNCWGGMRRNGSEENPAKAPITFEAVGKDDGEIASTLTIGSHAFYNCRYAVSLVIPKNTVSIGEYCFYYFSYGCSSSDDVFITFEEGCAITELPDYSFYEPYYVKSFVIPETVTSIGSYSLAYTRNLTEITIPAAVESVGSYAFRESTGLEKVTFAEGSKLKSIGSSAFLSCTFTEIELPPSLESMGQRIFYSCKSLEKVIFPEGSKLASIPDNAFQLCENLVDVNIPSFVTSVGSYAFSDCGKLMSVTLPSCIGTIETYAFQASGITEVTFEVDGGGLSSLSSIGSHAFESCSKLISFAFPETSADEIQLGDNVFTGATTLASLHLSSKVFSLGTALGGCSSIRSITVAESNPVYKTDNENKILYDATRSSIVYVYDDIGTMTIPNYITAIDSYAFAYRTKLTIITIPSAVTYIGPYAFYYCSTLQIVRFESSSVEEGALEIGAYAFANCGMLTSVSLPEVITELSEGMFKNCTSLTSISVPSTVLSIGRECFSGCTKLESVTLCEGLESIGAYAFETCRALTEIVIPSTVSAVGIYAFSGCTCVVSVKNTQTFVESSWGNWTGGFGGEVIYDA